MKATRSRTTALKDLFTVDDVIMPRRSRLRAWWLAFEIATKYLDIGKEQMV